MYSNSRNGATPFFFDIIKQRDHKYATPPPWKQFYVFLATAPTRVLTAGTALDSSEKQIYGKGVAYLWKNEGVAPLRELLYCKNSMTLFFAKIFSVMCEV